MPPPPLLRRQLNATRTAFLAPAGLGNEEQSGRGAGEGFHVLLVVAAQVTQQQVVEDAHHTHQQQESQDAFSKQITRGAAKEVSIKNIRHMIVTCIH